MESNIFDLIKDANEITLRNHGNLITLERAIFLSWWCDKETALSVTCQHRRIR